MSHAEHRFERIPAHVALSPDEEGAPADFDGTIRLLVHGQGTVGFAIAEKRPFRLTVRSDEWGDPGFRWSIGFGRATLEEHRDGGWRELTEVVRDDAGLDRDPTCPYWFSIDAHNRVLRYGKGEMRLGCAIGSHALPPAPADRDDPYAWLLAAREVHVSAAFRGAVDLWRDPVVAEPPMRVIPRDQMTMDKMAEGVATVPANLTPTCQTLYENVAGKAFELDTPDFPHFADAIKESIADPDGWCHQKLEEKANEFGVRDETMTYLRITLGQNQGESPGIPFVMEIWPQHHYSPIHNHGGAEAVIKVLHGTITVDLYPMLSSDHDKPFGTEVFHAGEVTWISARLNQFHKLTNRRDDEPCITIQCYLYAATNDTHWPYFDYLSKRAVGHFDPNSDMDYVAFKRLMKEEYERRHGPG